MIGFNHKIMNLTKICSLSKIHRLFVESEWIGYGNFSVYLKFDEDTDFMKDIFYFCHVSNSEPHFVIGFQCTISHDRAA